MLCYQLLVLGFYLSSALADTLSFQLKEGSRKGLNRLQKLHENQVISLDQGSGESSNKYTTNQKGISTSLPSNAFKGSLFTTDLIFGTQTIPVTLDTGSATLWVSSSSRTTPSCRSHVGYNETASATFQLYSPKTTFEIQYGSGQCSGELGTETLSIAHGFHVNYQLFGVVTKEEGSVFNQLSWSGIWGLGYPSLGAFEGFEPNPQFRPLFDSIMNSNQLSQNTFSFALGTTPPMFYLGAPPIEKYKGALQLFPVIDKYYWTIALEDVLVDNRSLGFCKAKGCSAVLDSGTSFMGVPEDVLPVLLNNLVGDSVLDRCQEHGGQVITYVLSNGARFDLDPQDYYLKNHDQVCKAAFFGLEVNREEVPPVYILGDVFFRKYFILFDREHDQVGIAPLVQEDEVVNLVAMKQKIISALSTT